jgi:hypothetical protein
LAAAEPAHAADAARGDKIGAILASRSTRTSFRSIRAARLMGKPLGGFQLQSRLVLLLV